MKIAEILLYVCALTLLSVLGTLVVSNQLYLIKKIKISKKDLYLLIKVKFRAVTIKPAIEEIFVRYYIYDVLGKCVDDSAIFCFLYLTISSFTFSIIHLPKTMNLFFEKLLIGGLYYSLIYCHTSEILITVLVHALHNIIIFIISRSE